MCMKRSAFLILCGCLTVAIYQCIYVIDDLDFKITDSSGIPKESLYEDNSSKSTKLVIAIYFPQFHQFHENDLFWGKGYTDFVGVGKASRNIYGQHIIRPSEHMGFYDLSNPESRQHQGQLAKKYGIHGFAIYHYWFKDRAVMEKPLQLLLEDGYPDIPFFFIWANEPWTRRWDGQNGSEVLMAQEYDMNEWTTHFKWMLPFFRTEKYIQRKGKLVLGLYRASEVSQLEAMTSKWQEMARQAGFEGIFFIQMNGVEWTPGAYEIQAGMDATAEFFPNFYWESGFSMNEVLATTKRNKEHFWGSCSSFDDSPRHVNSSKTVSVVPSHPSVLKFWLRQNLARSEKNDFVFLNAWNEWGEGAAIEPSFEWGRRWLAAVKEAVDEEAAGEVAEMLADGFVRSIPLKRAGVPSMR